MLSFNTIYKSVQMRGVGKFLKLIVYYFLLLPSFTRIVILDLNSTYSYMLISFY